MKQFERVLPSFKLINMPCGPLNVVAIIRPDAAIPDVEEALKTQQKLPSLYFFKVLCEAISALPDTCRTKQHNLSWMISTTKTLPQYFRIYQEDLTLLAVTIDLIPTPWCPYEFTFACWKYGQQQRAVLPLTWEDFNLDQLFCPDLIERCCFHLAVTYSANDDAKSLVWDLKRASRWSPGKD